jgi:hypothetical protein
MEMRGNHRLVVLSKLLLAACAAALLTACGSVQADIQQAADRNWLSYAVGKPYASISAQKKSTMEGLFQDDRAAGEVFSSSELAGGDRLFRHLDRYQSSTASSSFGGLVGKDSATYSYRLLYFRVSPDGMVRDYANGFVGGETSSCVGWIGGIFKKCEDEAALRQTVQSYDSFVKTSQGQMLSSWGLQET